MHEPLVLAADLQQGLPGLGFTDSGHLTSVWRAAARSPRAADATVAPAMRCLYVDLDGTLLGPGASLLTGADGGFSLLGVRALEACARADVEVVIYSPATSSFGSCFSRITSFMRRTICCCHG